MIKFQKHDFALKQLGIQCYINIVDKNICGINDCVRDNKSDWGSSLGLQAHVITVRFFAFFFAFFFIIQKRDFLRVFALLHMFSRTTTGSMCNNSMRYLQYLSSSHSTHPPDRTHFISIYSYVMLHFIGPVSLL